jgi:DNA-binding GntR family transcriptional regulator
VLGADNSNAPPAIECKRATTVRPSQAEMDILQLNSRIAMPRVLRIERHWTIAARLVCVETITVEDRRFPGLLQDSDLTAIDLKPLYAARFNVTIDRRRWAFKAIPANHPARSLLDDGQGTALISCRRTSFDDKDMPIEICDQILRIADEAYEIDP